MICSPGVVVFAKYQGCENDFIVVVEQAIAREEVVRLCHRRTGVGADGVLALSKENGVWRMRIINADGSDAEMCGNGFRCAVKHLIDHELVQAPLQITTDAGTLSATFTKANGKVDSVTVDMGAPRSAVEALVLKIAGREFRGHTVSMGNPHFVIESAQPEEDAHAFGLALSTHEHFARGCNIEFVKWTKDAAECVVYERGAGLTQACGTGACAVAVVGKKPKCDVRLPGGVLRIELDESVFMTGPVAWVFDGTVLDSTVSR